MIAAAIALVGCAKVTPDNNAPVKGKTTLTATFPEFVDATTRAAVSEAGVFSWTVSDKIDVVYVKGEESKTYTFSCTDAENGKFTYNEDIEAGYVPSVAYYPTGYKGEASNQQFSSIEDAEKGFQMTATYSDGKLNFVHDNALLKVTLNNVPFFVDKLTVGGASVGLSFNDDQESVVVYVPIAPAAAANMQIAVTQGVNNFSISKISQQAVEIKKAAIYPLPELDLTTKYIKVGVIEYIYDGWNLKDNWKVHYWGDAAGDADLIAVNITENKYVGYWNDAQKFYLYYTVGVPANISGFKVWCNVGDGDWYGSDAAPTITKAYVFDYDGKKAYYE